MENYMKRALELAKKGCGWVSPNPMVGAVIVKNGQIIGEGYHAKYGELHAERAAIKSCTQSVKGATMYVTLEPCCHYGKQPPCVDAILQSGISTVVVGSSDPNPLVSGKGVKILRENGVNVIEHVLENECDNLNEVFFHFIKTKTPFVVMKYAMTFDGKIAAYTGKSKWITGETARNHVQEQRHRYSAIMVGVGTVLADDPFLTCRIPNSKNPVRIICDTKLRTPLNSKVVTTAKQTKTIIATCETDKNKILPYENVGCVVISIKETNGHVDLKELMCKLGQMQIDSILLEGGGTLNWSALESSIVRKIQAYIAPKLLGGQTAKTPIEGIGVKTPDDAFILSNSKIVQLGDDILIESEVLPNVHRDC